MIDFGKKNLLGINISAVDYETAVARIIAAAKNRKRMTVSAAAVHGVMTGVLNSVHGYRLNHIDMIVPDGQPVRWGLKLLHGTILPDRVYGPELLLRVCDRAAGERIPIYFYGSTENVLRRLTDNLKGRFPTLEIAGAHPSFFRQISEDEKIGVVRAIETSGAKIIAVGLGCPRQEVWVYEHRDILPMPALAVGAAFDFHAGTLSQAPLLMQRYGLEWLYRLQKEPKRLWRRYLGLNPYYLWLVGLQRLGIKRFPGFVQEPPANEIRYG